MGRPLTDVLVFSKTTQFRHESIPTGIAAIRALGEAHGFRVTATEDAEHFGAANLSRYQVVVFLSTSGDVFDPPQREAFQAYIGAGGGFVGIHGASNTEYDWPFFGGLVGAYFADHPKIAPGVVRVEDSSTKATAHLGSTWSHVDEWYNFRTNPRDNVRVLLSLDENSVQGATMGDHPITWFQHYEGGRSFYTALGHTDEAFSDPTFIRLVLGGIEMAAGDEG